MKTFQLYIGSNNETHELELSKIEEICARRHQGFTVYPATGYWLGVKESRAVVAITDTQANINATIVELKAELSQDAIAWQSLPQMHFA